VAQSMALPAALLAQVSVEEAEARLLAKQQARARSATQPATMPTVEALMSEITDLKRQVALLTVENADMTAKLAAQNDPKKPSDVVAKPRGHISEPSAIVRAMPSRLTDKPADKETELDTSDRTRWVTEYASGKTIELTVLVGRVRPTGDNYTVEFGQKLATFVGGVDCSGTATFGAESKAQLLKVKQGDFAIVIGRVDSIQLDRSQLQSIGSYNSLVPLPHWHMIATLNGCKVKSISSPTEPARKVVIPVPNASRR